MNLDAALEMAKKVLNNDILDEEMLHYMVEMLL